MRFPYRFLSGSGFCFTARRHRAACDQRTTRAGDHFAFTCDAYDVSSAHVTRRADVTRRANVTRRVLAACRVRVTCRTRIMPRARVTSRALTQGRPRLETLSHTQAYARAQASQTRRSIDGEHVERVPA